MTIDQVRDVLSKVPFEPFDIVLANGTRYTIKHPEYVDIPPKERTRIILVYSDIDEDEHFRSHWIDLNLITAIVSPSEQEITK